jgi:Leucine-rich repeat (LRR) protein
VLFALANRFEIVPESIGALPALRMLSFKGCALRSLGAVRLPSSIVWLILTDNQLESLPAQLGELVGMRKLMLSNNRLTALPPEMAHMSRLELLRLANNQLLELPRWLLEPETMPRLAWLALAGNPGLKPAPPRASLPTVRPSELALGEVLGQGTAGVVRRAQWRGTTVAVKEYAGGHSPCAARQDHG